MNTAILPFRLLAGCGWAVNIVLVRWSLDRTFCSAVGWCAGWTQHSRDLGQRSCTDQFSTIPRCLQPLASLHWSEPSPPAALRAFLLPQSEQSEPHEARSWSAPIPYGFSIAGHDLPQRRLASRCYCRHAFDGCGRRFDQLGTRDWVSSDRSAARSSHRLHLRGSRRGSSAVLHHIGCVIHLVGRHCLDQCVPGCRRHCSDTTAPDHRR